MNIFDLILAPVYLAITYGIALAFRKNATTPMTRKYYMPAFHVKVLGAIALGIIYQFYYGGGTPTGDTFNYFAHTKIINSAFLNSPITGFKLLTANGEYDNDTYTYAARMEWYHASTEYFLVKIGAFFGLLGLNTYIAIALFFAISTFSGMWAMFITFLKIYPSLTKQFAIAVLFLPSVFFWGSGFLKDSLTLGALGWLFWGFYKGAIEKKGILLATLVILISAYVIYSVKVYILLSFLPPAFIWIFNENNQKIKNKLLRIIARPLFFGIGLFAAYYGGTTLTKGDVRYDLENIGERTKINAEYLEYMSASQGGSTYKIGTFDGSILSMIRVAPQAIVVSLFRPFLWEVRNPVMLLSALEGLFFIYLTLKILLTAGIIQTFKLILSKPIVLFCIIFSLVFAFGVGTNSGNFGTLVRYKIPLMPFYLSGLYIILYHISKKKRKSIFRTLPKKRHQAA